MHRIEVLSGRCTSELVYMSAQLHYLSVTRAIPCLIFNTERNLNLEDIFSFINSSLLKQLSRLFSSLYSLFWVTSIPQIWFRFYSTQISFILMYYCLDRKLLHSFHYLKQHLKEFNTENQLLKLQSPSQRACGKHSTIQILKILYFLFTKIRYCKREVSKWEIPIIQ